MGETYEKKSPIDKIAKQVAVLKERAAGLESKKAGLEVRVKELTAELDEVKVHQSAE